MKTDFAAMRAMLDKAGKRYYIQWPENTAGEIAIEVEEDRNNERKTICFIFSASTKDFKGMFVMK